MKKWIALLLVAVQVGLLFCACGGKAAVKTNPNLDTSQAVTLTVCGPWPDCKAIENVALAFRELYPNCTVQYEYLQNFSESAVKRLETAPESVDFILCSSIQAESPFLPYVEDYYAHEELNLSTTNEALIKNFVYFNADPAAAEQLYCIPMGGELRGLYVNTTLLNRFDISVPTNAKELMAACETLKNAGYVPMNGNPGQFATRLMFPDVANIIANADNYDATYARVNSAEAGTTELFSQPFSLLYEMVENGYYNYKYVETELNMCIDTSDEGQARDFFDIADQDGSGDYEKKTDLGRIAFMPGTLSQESVFARMKDDYHSEIEYEFIMAPVGEEGGFAYLSPAHGIALNKNTAHMDWAIEFINFLFTESVNTQFAADRDYIPNTANAQAYILEKFDIPSERMSDLGQLTFDYNFYGIMEETLINIAKSNNPKYMDTDANGNPVMYSLAYYMQAMETALAAQREAHA